MRVLIEGTNTPAVYQFNGQAATLRIEAIKGFTTFNGQLVPPSNGNEQDFYLEVPLEIASNQLQIPTIELDSTEDAYPWDSPITGDVPGYRAYFKLANGRRIPYFNKFKVPTLADGDPSHTWDELRVFNRTFIQRFTGLDRYINVNEVQEWIQNAVGDLNKASSTNFGVTMLDVDPIFAGVPIAVGVNSPLLNTSVATGISVADHGAVADAVAIEDAIISLLAPTSLTSVAGGFNDSLIGKVIAVAGAGVSGATLITTIAAVPDANTLTLADAATIAVTDTRAVYGTDNTAAFQEALDAAAVSDQTRTVSVPRGNYLFATGSLTLAQGVRLQGSWEFPPDHMGYRYTNEPKPMSGDGTTLVVVANEGTATGSFIFLNSNSSLRGVSIFQPAQLASLAAPKIYPKAVEMFGAGPIVENVELVNSYQGIYCHIGYRHRIANIKGTPLLTGIYASQLLGVSHFENIVFEAIYTFSTTELPPYPMTPLMQWIHQNGTAFKVGRVDGANFLNCFSFAYFKGFKFVVDAAETTIFANGTGAPGGKAWAQFIGCGADGSPYPVDIDDVQGNDSSGAAGVTFIGSEFTSAQWFAFGGPELYAVFGRSTFTGRVGFTDCRFHLSNRAINIEGGGRVNITGCFFQDWSVNAIRVAAGTVTINGSTFKIGSTAPVVVITGGPWVAESGNMFEYQEHTVWDLSGMSAAANFALGDSCYSDSPKDVAITLSNGWANLGAGSQTASYAKRAGRVMMRGTIAGGTAAAGTSLMTTLPVGFRPPASVYFNVQSFGTTGVIQVAASGVVTIEAGSNTSLSLDGIEFSVR